jgi:signal transduction histidine kinase
MGGRARREPNARWGWWAFALALAAQGCTQAWATVHMLLRGTEPPFPSGADACSVLSLSLIITGLVLWPLASPTGTDRLRKGLDGLGAALSIFFISWFFALGPLFHRSNATPQERSIMVVFFLGNAVILGLCAYLGARDVSRFRGPLGWVTLGFGASFVEVTLQVPMTLAGRYHLGHPLDLLVLLAALCLFLAAHSPVPLQNDHPISELQDPSPSTLILPLLPAATALSFILAAIVWAPSRLDPTMVGLATTMAGMGLVRAVLALRDLQRLSSKLEIRVAERTEALEDMQQAMLRTERMNAMAVLGAGIAHDLNNALASVRAYAELAQARMVEGLPPETRHMDHILVAADQSVALTRRLMTFGHKEDGPLGPICLREELSHMETILRMLLGRHIALRLDLGAASAPILGGRAQAEQIFVNLIANARDAMPEGGTITVRLTTEIVNEQPFARIEVEDTGEGMSPEIQAKMFNPFFTTKSAGKGTGLGLASVRQLMQELGGTLAVASEVGVGTTFVLRFPLIEDSQHTR